MPRVQYTTWFDTGDENEANRLLDALFEADEKIVCPGPNAPWSVCENCSGSVINPEQDEPDDEHDERYAPGKPCYLCADSARPGWVQPCVREHHAGATIYKPDQYLEVEQEKTRTLLRSVLEAMDESPERARDLLRAELDELDELEGELREYARKEEESNKLPQVP